MSGVLVRNVTCRYPGAARDALRDVSLVVPRGTLTVVMGASGAGKSTLGRTLTRLVPVFSPATLTGEIVLDDESIAERSVGELAGRIGMVFQDFEAQLFSTDVMQEMVFALEQTGVAPEQMQERVTRALAAVGLSGFEGRDPTTLSGGEKQRLAIAGVLALRPGIMVLDEPTTDLDPQGRADVFRVLYALRSEGLALVVIEHDPAVAVAADQLLVLAAGDATSRGAPHAVLADVDACVRAGIRAPDISRVFAALEVPDPPLDVDTAIARLQRAGFGAPATLPPDPAPVAAAPRLVVDRVTFNYPDGPVVLRDITLQLGQGELVALVGHNGSGKTTLAKLLMGLLRPARGRVTLDGRVLSDLPPAQLARHVGYVFQDPDHQLFAATAWEEVAFGPRNIGCPPAEVEARVRAALAAVELDGVAHDDPFLLDKGARQRLAVASVLSLRPEVLLLDEPTTGLDFREQCQMLALLRRLHAAGQTILIIAHTPWVIAEYAERVVMLHAGALAYDGPVRSFFADDTLLRTARFTAPDVTRLGRAFGCTPLRVEELVASLQKATR